MKNDGKLRLLRLLELLRDESSPEHPITTAQLERLLKERWGMESYRITIQNDIAALVSAGYGIETIKSSQNKYFISDRLFELPELKLLIDAVESSKFIAEKKSKVLAGKLLKLTDKNTAASLKRNITISERIKPHNEHIYYFVDAINEAINEKRKISFLYFEFSAAKRRELKNGGMPYVFSPYTLTWNGNCYYMVGWSDKHGKVATFRVDRILKTPTVLDEPAVPKPKEYSIAEFAEKAFNLYDAERTRVELLCNKAAMNSVLDHFGEDAKTKRVDDSTFLLTAEVSLSPTFYAWIFQFFGRIKLVSPAHAVEKYTKMLKDAVAAHAEEEDTL